MNKFHSGNIYIEREERRGEEKGGFWRTAKTTQQPPFPKTKKNLSQFHSHQLIFGFSELIWKYNQLGNTKPAYLHLYIYIFEDWLIVHFHGRRSSPNMNSCFPIATSVFVWCVWCLNHKSFGFCCALISTVWCYSLDCLLCFFFLMFSERGKRTCLWMCAVQVTLLPYSSC